MIHRRLTLVLLAGMQCAAAAPALAQAGASVTLASDDRFRGHSISSGNPALTLELDLDASCGVYASASATGAVAEGSPEFVNFSENLGYAQRLESGTTIDLGVVRSDYTEYYSGGRPAHFTEVYLGFQRGRVSGYLRYSPDYLRPGIRTLYAEIDYARPLAASWRLHAHAGLLVQVGGDRPAEQHRASYDWELGVVRQIGRLDLGLAVAGGGPGPDYYAGYPHDRTALVASLRWHR